jgi:hypothetical protein
MTYFFKINFNIILPPNRTSPKLQAETELCQYKNACMSLYTDPHQYTVGEVAAAARRSCKTAALIFILIGSL